MEIKTFNKKLTRHLDLSKKVDVIASTAGAPETIVAYGALAEAYRRIPNARVTCLYVSLHTEHDGFCSRDKAYHCFDDTQTKKLVKDRGMDEDLEGIFNSVYDRRARGDIENPSVDALFVILSRDVYHRFHGRDDRMRNPLGFSFGVVAKELMEKFQARYPGTHLYYSAEAEFPGQGAFATVRVEQGQRVITRPEIKPNSLLVLKKEDEFWFVTLPPNEKHINCFRYNGYRPTPDFFTQFCSGEEYERYWWADGKDYWFSWEAFHQSSFAATGKAYLLCGLEAYGKLLESSLFDFKLRGRVSDNIFDLSVPELIEEVWNNPGEFKIILNEFYETKIRDRPVRNHRQVKLDEAETWVRSKALDAFENGKYLTYNDSVVPGIKRDFTYVFAIPEREQIYTMTFTYNNE